MQTDHLGGPVLLCMVPGTRIHVCVLCFDCVFFFRSRNLVEGPPLLRKGTKIRNSVFRSFINFDSLLRMAPGISIFPCSPDSEME